MKKNPQKNRSGAEKEKHEAHAHPSHAIRAYTEPTNEDIFSTQYAVRKETMLTQYAETMRAVLGSLAAMHNMRISISCNRVEGRRAKQEPHGAERWPVAGLDTKADHDASYT